MSKIKKFKVHFISVLTNEEEPANRRSVIYKSALASDFRFEFALKHFAKDAKKGLIFGTVYEPGVKDTQGDWADSEDIETAAHEFLIEKRVNMVDENHDYDPGVGTVVESFIKNGADARFPESKDGSWCVVIKLSDSAKANIKKINGLSMAGGGLYDLDAAPPKSSNRPAFGASSGRRTRKAMNPTMPNGMPDYSPAQWIEQLKQAGQWPDNYDDTSDSGSTMENILNAIEQNIDDKGITIGSGFGVLDALCLKLLNAPPDEDDDTETDDEQPDTPLATPLASATTQVSEKSTRMNDHASRIRPLAGDPRGTRLHTYTT